MRWFPTRRSRDDDLADEIRTHLEMSAQGHIQRGASPSEAAATARREFGNVGIVAEVTREAWGAGWLERLQHDLTFGARLLRRRPAFAVVAILSLALGIGATGAVYGVVDTILFRRLPLPAPQQLISLAARYPGEASARANFSFDAFKRIRDAAAPARLAAECIVDRARIVVEGGSTPTDARVSLVTAEYFSVLQAMPRLGRAITSREDEARDAGRVAVISDAIWRDGFQRRQDIIGSRFLLGGVRYSIIGVMPPGFAGDWPARPVAIWVPIAMQSTAMPEEPGLLGAPFNEWVRIIGRVPHPSAAAGMVAPAQQAFLGWANDMFSPQLLAFVSQARVTVAPMERGYSPERDALARPLIVFLSIVILVLLVACSNVANLMLAHAASREREMSLRIALGAGRFRLARQALTEAGLLAGTAALIGLLIALWGSAWLRAFVASGAVRTARDVTPSWSAIVASTLACLTVCAVFSIISSIRLTAVSNVGQLVGRNAGSTEPRHWKVVGRVLLVAQIALSLALVMSSGLFVRTLHNLRTQPLGFTRNHVVLLWASPAQAGINGLALAQAYSAVRVRVASLPGAQLERDWFAG